MVSFPHGDFQRKTALTENTIRYKYRQRNKIVTGRIDKADNVTHIKTWIIFVIEWERNIFQVSYTRVSNIEI